MMSLTLAVLVQKTCPVCLAPVDVQSSTPNIGMRKYYSFIFFSIHVVLLIISILQFLFCQSALRAAVAAFQKEESDCPLHQGALASLSNPAAPLQKFPTIPLGPGAAAFVPHSAAALAGSVGTAGAGILVPGFPRALKRKRDRDRDKDKDGGGRGDGASQVRRPAKFKSVSSTDSFFGEMRSYSLYLGSLKLFALR